MGTVIRLAVVGTFVAAVAAMALRSNLPRDQVVLLLGSIVASLVGAGALAHYQKQRDRAAELASFGSEKLYKPNEVILSTLLGYVQLGLLAVALATLARSLIEQRLPSPGLLLLALIPLALECLRRLLRKHTGHWASLRLRLALLTHRSLDAVILVDSSVGREPIRVQASYSRSNHHGERVHTELLWRSPSVSIEPHLVADRTEYCIQIAMPDDFADELASDGRHWRRQWHLAISVSASTTLNFNLNLPQVQTP